MDRALIVSSDCHVGAPSEVYRYYLEKRYHNPFDEYLEHRRDTAASRNKPIEQVPTDPEARTAFFYHQVDRNNFVRPITEVAQDADPVVAELARDRRLRYEYSRSVNVTSRLDEMESQGVVGEVLFPDTSSDNEIPFSGLSGALGGIENRYPPELQMAGHRAYNRWLADFCVAGRHIGLARVSSFDIEAAVREVHWARREGLHGVLLDGENPALASLYEAAYDPLWAACEQEKLPVHFHAVAGAPELARQGPMATEMWRFELGFWAHRPLWHLILGGVLERHPQLVCVWAESGSAWIPPALDAMDWRWEVMPPTRRLPMKPSAYWRRQGFVAASILTRAEADMRHRIGIDQMMFGTDLPHMEGTWRVTLRYLRATLGAAGTTKEEARKILGGNLLRCYGLDAAPFERRAREIGPDLGEILTPLEDDQMTTELALMVSAPAKGF